MRVVSLAGDKVVERRRRIQRRIGGRKGEVLYRARCKPLTTGADPHAEAQVQGLGALLADKHHTPVQAAWGVYQHLIQTYCVEGTSLGKYLMTWVVCSLRDAVPAGLSEVAVLAKTLTGGCADIPWPTSIIPAPPAAPPKRPMDESNTYVA